LSKLALLLLILVIIAGGFGAYYYYYYVYLPSTIITLKVLAWGGVEMSETLKEIISGFEQEHPNIKVEIVLVPAEQREVMILSMAQSGTLPDVLHFMPYALAEYVEAGILDEPPDYVIKDIKANYPEGAIEAVSYKGKIWGYPTEFDPVCLWYNKKLFEEAGLTRPPETWEEVIKYAKNLTKYDASGNIVQEGFALFASENIAYDFLIFLQIFYSAGGKFLSDDFTRLLINSSEGVYALSLIHDMISKHRVTDVKWGATEAFRLEKAAMTLQELPWRNDLEPAMGENFTHLATYLPPKVGGKRVTIAHIYLMGVASTSEHKKEAWELVHWLNTPRREGEASPLAQYFFKIGIMPSRFSDLRANPDYINNPLHRPFFESLNFTKPIVPSLRGFAEIAGILFTMMGNVEYGKAPPKAALDEAVAKASAVLSKYYGSVALGDESSRAFKLVADWEDYVVRHGVAMKEALKMELLTMTSLLFLLHRSTL